VRQRLLLAVFTGGIGGALLRAAVERAFPPSAGGWPWATFAVNVVGTVILAYVATQLQERLPPSTFPRPLLATGLCGALTTFSTVQIEVIERARHGHAALAVAYTLVTVLVGLAAVHAVTVRVRVGARA
jgi:CrcB protein